MKLTIIFIFFQLLFLLSIATKITDTTKISEEITAEFTEDNPILEMLDSLIVHDLWCEHDFSIDTHYYNMLVVNDSIPSFSADIIKKRIEKINKKTPYPLTYNKYVNAYINVYAKKIRSKTGYIFSEAKYYFPIFEEILDKYNLPLELKYLAIVESALNPKARSRSGAVGLWQFMYNTGKIYDLKITSYIDERSDIYKSTEAACQYFTFLYSMYHDWNLVLAAYNAGPGNVNKAIRRSGGVMDYWQLRPFLPRETRGYVPAFIAVNYVANYAKEHQIYATEPKFYHYDIDTVKITDYLNFNQISEALNISKDVLEYLNPIYRHGIIPAGDNDYSLALPVELIGDFINNEDYIYNYGLKKGEENEKVVEEVRFVHYVKRGECLGKIADNHNCKVRDLMNWNNLRSTRLRIGQPIIIYQTVTKKTSNKTKSDSKKTNSTKPEKKLLASNVKYHTVQKGDTLWDIADKYQGVSVADLKRLNNINNAKHLKPGMKIKVSG